MLPHDFPPCQTVYGYFRQWKQTKLWQRINDLLRRQVRVAAGRDPEPSAAILDSHTVKTTEQGGTRGYDAAKKINGRKRHILVDTLGLLLC
jgi:putative transposase